ncbi:hypothetical protein DT23_01400 [Thioclava indica]|uniref:Uncharacterized protein n=1 Tax=Thioclava indica TaxID=1353528 RepID=A0A074K0E3_9RHOB|nr:hypothetical protein DT23_01400 [Thioclava indica]
MATFQIGFAANLARGARLGKVFGGAGMIYAKRRGARRGGTLPYIFATILAGRA